LPNPEPKPATENLPKHIAVIMDGNGRWAKARGMKRTQGHKEGLEAAKKIVKKTADLGIPYITLYTFSTENWKRTEEEVGFLMSLISSHLRAELDFYVENRIRVAHAGDLARLPANVVDELAWVTKETAGFKGTTVTLAINYGGQDEIVRAIKKLTAAEIDSLTPEIFTRALDVPDAPPVDFMIRTAGERRISNFLLWQSAYAELYFSDLLWPDFDENAFMDAIGDYQARERRFGAV